MLVCTACVRCLLVFSYTAGWSWSVFVVVDLDYNDGGLPYFVWPQICAGHCFFLLWFSFEGGPQIWPGPFYFLMAFFWRRAQLLPYLICQSFFSNAMVIRFSFGLLPYLIWSHHEVDCRHQSSPDLMETFSLTSFHPSDEEGGILKEATDWDGG